MTGWEEAAGWAAVDLLREYPVLLAVAHVVPDLCAVKVARRDLYRECSRLGSIAASQFDTHATFGAL